MKSERLIYLPLGGAGEIGMNAYVYGYGAPGKERLILVDMGVTFPDMDGAPGVEVIMPDITWLEERVSRLEAIFITHAHEDHIGALGHLWPKLKAKVYARKFTSAIGRLKLDELGHPTDAIVTVGARPDVVEAGPFRVQFVPLSHSIPESAALIIDTPAGRVVHSGDFKLDRSPVVGEAWDDALWQSVADEAPVKALMCDSTNVFSTHPGRSEATLAEPLAELIHGAGGMFVATTFGSNVARLKTLAEAAVAADRTICVMGRSMKRMLSVAQETGVLTSFPRVVSTEDALSIPRANLMLLVTGSQGERRAAAAALSRGKYLGHELKRGDTFLFSSRTIPGNEKGVYKIWNEFSEKGVRVVDDAGGLYHVSGHANRPDLEHVHRLLLPDMLIPMHGEHRHLTEHARIGSEGGIATQVAVNGMMVDLTGEHPKVVEYIETGRLYLDGTVLIGALDGVIRNRIRMALNGHVMATVILDETGEPLGEPWVEIMGLTPLGNGGRDLAETMEAELDEWMGRAGRKVLKNDEKVEDDMRRIIRQVAVEEIGKKPEVTVVVSRLLPE